MGQGFSPACDGCSVTEALLLFAFFAALAAPAAAQPVASPPPFAYLILEVPSLRVVAQARPDVLGAALAPGSVMKAFTMAAALESGAATPETRILCRRTVDLDGKPVTCVHPDLHRSLDPVEALSQSCNVYFATLARRLPRQALDDLLVRAGLSPSDAAVPMPRVALGIEGVRATPRQWLEGFLRLTGTAGPALSLRPETQRVLRLGFESAVRTGTASALWKAGYSGLAKTGTASMPGGGAMGLVVAVVHTELPSHAIVVVAPGANGATAARLAGETLARHGVPRTSKSGADAAPGGDPRAIRVGRLDRSQAYDVSSISVEDYVAKAVAGEGGPGIPAAALDALAITVRTYAERNRGRHAADGFDVCDLTHCLALRSETAESRRAATRTAGRVLLAHGRVAEVYLSAACGGHTAKPSEVWRGATDSPHLPAAPDLLCRTSAPWVAELPEVQLRRALESAGLKGAHVDGLRVAKATNSGRVTTLSVDGMVPPTVAGNSFRAAAGRIAGWGAIKSTLFMIERTATGYRFVGRGRGHGVGLCVEGAALRAAAGADSMAILAAYFPGTTVSPKAAVVARIVLPETEREQAGGLRSMVEREVGVLSAKLGLDVPGTVDVVFHPTVESFGRATGLPWWAAARTKGTRIDLVPLAGLKRRGIVETTIRHELVHVLVGERLADRPLWVREGLAIVMAGEAVPGSGGASSSCPTDAELRGTSSPEAWKAAYQAAGRCVARALAGRASWRDLR